MEDNFDKLTREQLVALHRWANANNYNVLRIADDLTTVYVDAVPSQYFAPQWVALPAEAGGRAL